MKYLILLVSCTLAVLFMALSLHFSGYRKRTSICRGDGLTPRGRAGKTPEELCLTCTQSEHCGEVVAEKLSSP